MITVDRGVRDLLRKRRPSPIHVVDPFKVPVAEAVEKAVAVAAKGLPFLILASTDYEDFDGWMPGYVARVKAAVDLPVITHFPPRPGAGLPVAPGADGMLCPALLGSRDDYFVWKSIIETVGLLGGRPAEDRPELVLEAALTFGDDHVSFDALATDPIVPTPESMDAQIGLTRLLALDAVYLYSRFTGVPPEVTRYFRQRLHPDQLIFVGGGIRSRAQVDDHIDAGADYVIFAGALETPDWRPELDRLCAPAREQAAAVQERNPHD